MSDLQFNFEIPHPGELIREELAASNWTQRDLAFVLGVKESNVTQILNGKRGITTDTALALSGAFGVSAELFNNLQWEYDQSRARAVDDGIDRVQLSVNGRTKHVG
ncbi:MAG: HigA family addiction module antitoxin [Candidatus Symbiobacter sp.]|nr:HigA family addiction module antitoxin [Candidatus Symbiobacter sp.]